MSFPYTKEKEERKKMQGMKKMKNNAPCTKASTSLMYNERPVTGWLKFG